MLIYQVEGLGCDLCASAVERAIVGVAPEATVIADVGDCRLYLDGPFDPVSIEAVISAAGYAAVEPCREAGGLC